MNGELKTEAVVIRSVKYKDYDKMLTLFTKDRGLMSVSVRGAQRMKSQLAALSTPFVTGEFVIAQRVGVQSLRAGSIEKTRYALRESPAHLSCAALAAQLCCYAVQPEEANEGMYALVDAFFDRLQDHEPDAKGLLLCFLMRFVDMLGLGMSLDRCAACGGLLKDARFDFELGGLVCREHAPPGAQLATKELVMTLRSCREGGLAPIKGAVEEGLVLMQNYIEYRLERGFAGFSYAMQMLKDL